MADDPRRPESGIGNAAPAVTPEQLAEADDLLRLSHLALVRGDTKESDRMLERALEVAPGSAQVLEEMGDRQVKQRKLQAAKESYAAALAAEPSRASAERKYGETVLALQMVLDPSKILGDGLSEDDSFVSARALPILSFLVPGLGQIVNGEVPKGLTMLLVWAGSILLTGMLSDQFRTFGSLLQSGSDFNALALLPLFSAVMAFGWSVGDAASTAKLKEKRQIVRPTPPVDKEF